MVPGMKIKHIAIKLYSLNQVSMEINYFLEQPLRGKYMFASLHYECDSFILRGFRIRFNPASYI